MLDPGVTKNMVFNRLSGEIEPTKTTLDRCHKVVTMMMMEVSFSDN